MCDPKGLWKAAWTLNPLEATKGALGSLTGPAPNIPGFKKPKLLQPDTAGAESTSKLKALAAYSVLDTKKTGPKGLGSAPSANKMYATLLGG